jgi:hypothetical protein
VHRATFQFVLSGLGAAEDARYYLLKSCLGPIAPPPLRSYFFDHCQKRDFAAITTKDNGVARWELHTRG